MIGEIVGTGISLVATHKSFCCRSLLLPHCHEPDFIAMHLTNDSAYFHHGLLGYWFSWWGLNS